MMSKADRKKLCAGCRANRYNMGKGFVERAGIDAVVTVDECWHLASSKVVSKEVYFSPGDIRPFYVDRTLSCWHNNIGLGSIVKRVKAKKK